MDIYDSSYLSINRKLLSFVGLWPYENKGRKIILRLYYGSGIIIMAIPHVIGLQMYLQVNTERALEHVGVIMYCSMTFMKLITSILSEKKLKVVYDDIASNWQMITDANEREKLIEHFQKGKFLTLVYTIYCYVGYVLFITLPLVPIILNEFMPLNESRPNIFILNGEFLIDRDTNYEKIYAFDCVTILITVFIFTAVDSAYIVTVQHCIGLFAVIKFQDILETSFSLSFLVLMSITLLYLSILSVLVLANINRYLNLIRYCALLWGIIIHLFYISWPGQQLIDYSSGLFRDAYLNEWYAGSGRSKKLLRILTLRCVEPCVMTAGGIYIMNLQNFLSVLKTSASYITVFGSYRN